MILKLIYFFIIFVFFEASVLSLITINFVKNTDREYKEIKESADSNLRFMALSFSRYLEKNVNENDSEDINTFFSRSVLTTKGNFIVIKNIYYLSQDGGIISSYNSNKDFQISNTNLPLFSKTLRLRRGQVEQSLYDNERNEPTGFFQKKILDFIPELSEKSILVSSPVYIQDKMEVCCSVHILYERLDFEEFLINKKNQYRELFILTTIIGLIFSLLLWLVFYFFVGYIVKDKINENSYESLLRKEVKKTNINDDNKSSDQSKNSKSLDAVFLD